MQSLRNLLLLIVVICTLSFTISNEVTKTYEKSNISAGKVSPEFSFKNTKDEVINLKDLRGKYVYINFWTTWSTPSNEELPYFNELTEEFGKNITFVNISVDYQKDIKKWKQFVKDQQLKGIQLIANNNWQSDFIKAFDVVKIPRSILIDKDGKIITAFGAKPSQSKELIANLIE